MKVNKLREVRLNTHQQHLESLPIFGKSGLNELNNYIEKFLKQLTTGTKELTLMSKIDGAPSVFMWHKIGNGYPDNSIALKSFVNGPSTAMSSAEEIDKKYSDRPDMAEKLKQCLKLSKYIPQGEAWQGDCLFTKNDLKEEEINGINYVIFHPNKIVYAFSEDNPGYNSIKNADFGIAFHTIYTINNGAISQSFEVDNSRINAPDNFYLLFHEMGTQNKENDFNVDKLVKDFSELKQIENKLINDSNYEELINNKQFINYWNTFENREFADNKKTNINPNTILKDLKNYILNKKEQEFNKKQSTLKTDQGREKAKEKYDRELLELEDLLNNNKDTIINIVNVINKAADIKMDLWRSLNKTKDDYSSFYKSKSKGYIPANREGISMSDADGNLVKIVDRSEFSSNNRNQDFESGFAHESLKEEIERDLTKEEIANLFKDLNKIHHGASGNCGNLALAVAREIPNKNKEIVICSNGQQDEPANLEDYTDYDLDVYHVALRVDKNMFDYLGNCSLDNLEKFCIDNYDDDDPIIFTWRYDKNEDNNFRKLFEWNTNYDVYPEFYQKHIRKLLNKKEEGFGVATQGGDMGSFKSFTKVLKNEKLTEAVDKVAVVAVGRMNPPTIGHKALVNALVKIGNKYGVKPKLFLTHSANNAKNPLSYESKIRWAAKAFGNDVEIVKSNARSIIEFLSELYNEGYTKVIYAGDKERIGGTEDVSNSILKYNGNPDKSGKLLYNFDEIIFENTGDREIPYEGAQNSSATHVRKLATEKNFNEFKKYVPFNEQDAKNLFDELRYALKDSKNFVEKYLKEATPVTPLTKKKLIDNPDMVDDLEKELDKIDKRLDVPDLNKGIDDYRIDPKKYQGLYVKQDSSGRGKVSFSTKDIANYAEKELGKKGELVAKKVDDITIEDEKGKDYKLYSSDSTLYTAKGGVSWNDRDEITYYQECIQLLLLTNSLNYQGDLLEWLKESDRKQRSNLFKYVEPFDKSKVNDEGLFRQYWDGFIKSFGKAFEACDAQSNEFISEANAILKSSGKLIPLHGGIISPWSKEVGIMLAGQDDIDKSDGYVVSAKNKSKIGSILNKMIELKRDAVEYVKFMEKAPILGVSLKKNNGRASFDYNEPPIKKDDVKEIYFTTSDKGNKINFNLEGKETSLDIRSAGGVKVEFRPKGEPAYGNAVKALKRTLGDNYEKFGNYLKARKFRDATRYLIALLCGEKSPKENIVYKMTNSGKQAFADIFNFAAGRPIYNKKGERLTAPYMKVH